jgi:Cytochrome P450
VPLIPDRNEVKAHLVSAPSPQVACCRLFGSLSTSSGLVNVPRCSRHRRSSTFLLTLFRCHFIPTDYFYFHTFFLAMRLFPDVQRKAHKEILSVIGTGRLPDIKARPLLPYLDAVVKVTLRCYPPVPLGISIISSGQSFAWSIARWSTRHIAR